MRIQILFFLILLFLLYSPIIEKFLNSIDECNKYYDVIRQEKEKEDENYENKKEKKAQEETIKDGIDEMTLKTKISEKEAAYKDLTKTIKDSESIYSDYNNKKTGCEAELSNFGFKLSDAKDKCKNGKKEVQELNDLLAPIIDQNNKIIDNNNKIQNNINTIQNKIDDLTNKYNNNQNKIKDLTNKLYLKNGNHLN
jgi:chromosome segregation ATPase